jgi:hypothetical protein
MYLQTIEFVVPMDYLLSFLFWKFALHDILIRGVERLSCAFLVNIRSSLSIVFGRFQFSMVTGIVNELLLLRLDKEICHLAFVKFTFFSDSVFLVWYTEDMVRKLK